MTKLSRTRARDLLLIAVVAGLLSFALLRAVGSSGTVPTVPWLAAATLLIVGVALIVTARALKPRLQRKPGTQPVPPLLAGRLVALAFAASRAGAVIAGFYAGWLGAALLVTDGLDSPYGRTRALSSGAATLAAIVVIVGGVMLERALTIEADGTDGPNGDQAGASPA